MKGIAEQLIQDRIEYLRENTDFVATLFESLVGYAIIAADFDGNVIAYNEGARLIYGYAREEIIGKQNIEIFFPKDLLQAGGLQHIVDELVGKERLSYVGEKVRKNGETFPAQILFTLTKDKNSKVVGFIEIVEDLSERKRAEETLRLSRERLHFQNVVENSTDGIIVTDQRGIMRLVNPAAEALFGRNAEELLGELFGFPLVVGETTELDIVHRDRETGFAEMRAAEIEWEDKTAYLLSLHDITERKRMEEKLQQAYNELRESQVQLIQSEKMSAVGTLVAGVAHELNNPMTGILNFSQYCLKHTSEDDRRYTILQDIEHETKRCVDIVRNLLTFSRIDREDEAYQKESCTVILNRVFRLLSYAIEKQGVSLTYHTADGTPEIWMKVNSIQQVFLNLINNALNALEESEKKEIHVDICRDGEFVQVTIGDTGRGIAPENVQRIFDPFFTTKPVGQGTGLGLSVSRAIIDEHGGEITCESEPGAGTKFKVLLPVEKRKEGAK